MIKERSALECIEDIADAQYRRTGDKWWLRLCIDVAKKQHKRRYYVQEEKT